MSPDKKSGSYHAGVRSNPTPLAMKHLALSLALFLGVLGVLSVHVNAQTGVAKAPIENQGDERHSRILKRIEELEIEINGMGNYNPVMEGTTVKGVNTPGHKSSLQLHELALSDEENAIVKDLLKQIKHDAKTLEMVAKMRSEEAHTLEAMFASLSGPEKVRNLKMIIGEFQAVEVLFKDPVRAVKMMNEDGLIPPARLPEYQRNPQLLEDDTRKGLFFTFVTLALALDLM